AGQTVVPPEEQPLLGLMMNDNLLRELPTSNSPFTVLETIPEVITDRFSSSGLNAAAAPRLGAFLNSWTQTQFRIGDLNVTDPRTGGTPLLLPLLPFFERVTTATGGMGVEENAPGVSMTLEALRPAKKWFSIVEGAASGPSLVWDGPTEAPAVDRVRQWRDGS